LTVNADDKIWTYPKEVEGRMREISQSRVAALMRKFIIVLST